MMSWRHLAALGAALALSACDMAPDYHAPEIEVPIAYKETGPWLPAQPADAEPRGNWWRDYRDEVLDQLEAAIDTANPNLAAASAAYDRARAFAAQAEAGLLPNFNFAGGLSDNRQSDNRPLRSKNQPTYYGANTIGFQSGYEVDLWGRVKDLISAGQDQAQASEADLESVRLSLHAELAGDYVSLRGLDLEAQLLADTVANYEKALRLTQTLFAGKIASAIDVSRAQSQLSAAQAQVSDVTGRRALLEHAIASLVGRPASSFSIAVATHQIALPAVPLGLPSTLLQRRPDVAAAERRVAAANQLVGVAKAAFYPSLTIGASFGTQDTELNLMDLPNRFWSIGPSVNLPIFNNGLLDAQLAASKASFDQAGQYYRATVLQAFQEIEDNLALLHWLQQEAKDEETASAAAERTLQLSLNLYRDGIASYLEVVTAQTEVLTAERAVLSLRTRQLQANIGLIRALGGGWSEEMLAKDKS